MRANEAIGVPARAPAIAGGATSGAGERGAYTRLFEDLAACAVHLSGSSQHFGISQEHK